MAKHRFTLWQEEEWLIGMETGPYSGLLCMLLEVISTLQK
jgi:hypothetical protein